MKLIERLRPFFKPKEATLEIGAFEGAMTQLLIKEFDLLEVVEAAEDLATELSRKFPATKVHCSKIELWDNETNYENVFLVHTLEHIDNRVAALRKVATLLSDSGLVFIAVPNADALSRLIAVEMGVLANKEAITEGERLHGHTITYTLESLKREVLESGLKIIHSGGVILKTMSNGQIDKAMDQGVISSEYLDACDQLSQIYPQFSSSIYVIASKPRD